MPSGVISLSEMEQFVEDTSGRLLSLSKVRLQKHTKDSELKAVDALLDDAVINRLLAPEHYTASMRTVFPYHFLRPELLKSLKYPEFNKS